ncbi:MAG: ribosome biogenesis GTP-binding protein YihA/YsxC [Gammaproteobacteria bacterium]|nr:ribosome biogenesis GTP-binding protein YihA/YsxC [Gammaproteobacteria bacterium]MCZ6488406.1 ribosome biogenesis GTP-binding protein YihA/YsxC [Gammaproteobacteria bacterium]MCZ6669060.1 ribosome biogenesis GTP-binding protein YihA/YsxC [Gammaproteobacteria bacterium]MCZ6797255.1 ribosome biogenesis GTP-binding protein YihA/YsxC [Gammaproteobacteria bacterium]MCZ6882157.1 ribosome biogenesis GTP-binding protein YihA/YsxC [Gammaproteobacteria bacterium]
MANSFRQAKYLTSAFELSQLLPDEGMEIAFAGRSNAGKSSAINCLTGQKGLCKTSKTPGRTQLINFFELDEQRRLVDLPGYGFARVPKKMRSHWNQVLSSFLLKRNALKGLIIVVDIRRGISYLDQALFDMVGMVLPIHVLLTKSDKLTRSAVNIQIMRTRQQMKHKQHTVSSLSTLNRRGLEQLEQRCKQWLDIK